MGSLWDESGIILGSVWDDVGIMLGWFLDHPRMNKSCLEDPFAVLFHLGRWAGEAYEVGFWKKCWSKMFDFLKMFLGRNWLAVRVLGAKLAAN